MTLGADVLPGTPQYGFVLTRLHYRYGADDLGEDIVFRAASPIVGGRGMPDQEGNLEQGTQPGSINNFQGRYVILHPWEGPLACESPMRGQWGGPPDGRQPQPMAAASQLTRTSDAAPSQANLGIMVAQDIPEIGVTQGVPVESEGTVVVDRGPPPAAAQGDGGGCASCDVAGGGGPWGALALSLVVAAFLFRRRI
jgi:MYXO-CTERM domain-containing protein